MRRSMALWLLVFGVAGLVGDCGPARADGSLKKPAQL